MLAAVLAVAATLAAPAHALPAPPVEQVPTCRGVEATIVGTDGDDVLRGTPGDDVIVAGKGNDSVYAGAGNDIVCGNGGADSLWGEAGRDVLLGGGGADTVIGGDDKDKVRGGSGADRCEAPFLGERRSASCNDVQTATQSNIPAARDLLESSRAMWAAWLIDQDTDDYGFDIELSCECDEGSAEIDVVDGVAYWRNLTGALETNRTFFTVDNLFDHADSILDRLEEDPSIAGDPATGEGAFFTLTVDAGTGFPYLVGDNGPADGGVDYRSIPRSVLQDNVSVPKGSEVYTLDMLALANPDAAYDELISVVAQDFGDELDPEVVTKHGAPCLDMEADASAACEAELAGIAAALTFDDEPLIHWECGLCAPTIAFMVARSGTDLTVIGASEWLAALGTIDTAAEVPFVLQDNAQVKPRRNGFVALTTNFLAECDPIVSRHAINRVSAAGKATVAKVGYGLEYGICI